MESVFSSLLKYIKLHLDKERVENRNTYDKLEPGFFFKIIIW